MVGADQRLSLSHGSHHDFRLPGALIYGKRALRIIQHTRKLLIEQQILRRFRIGTAVQGQSDVDERRVAGICKGAPQVLEAMHRTVKTADRYVIGCDLPRTFVGIIFIIRVLPHILQRRHHLKGRSRRVGALGGAVEHRAVVLIRVQIRPVHLYLIRIIGRLGQHHQDFSGGCLHHDHSPLIISQRLISRLL